ncbi:MAG: hypothetical protein KGK08_12135 [Acidobacteriota bacterium]|nr:hypothetical protein [Acidobacteriota bacterium]
MRHNVWATGVLLLAGCGAALAQAPGADTIALRMQAHNAERTAALEGYQAERVYRVHYQGTGGEHEAEMHVRLEFRAPGAKHFVIESESGSKFLCDKVLKKLVESEEEAAGKAARLQLVLSPENYNLQLVGEETWNGVPAWVLQVEPKVADKFSHRGRVWISKDDYGLMRVVGEPAKSPSWFLSRAAFEYRYGREGGRFWLPMQNESSSHVRIGGEATLSIEYSGYQIETVAKEVAALRR